MNVRTHRQALLLDPSALDLYQIGSSPVNDVSSAAAAATSLLTPGSDVAGGGAFGAGGPFLPEENGSGSTTTAVAATGNAIIDGVLSGVKWSAGINYADTDSAADYQAGYSSDQNANGISAQNEAFSQFTSAQRIALHAALNVSVYTQLAGAVGFSIEGFTNLSITYAGSGVSSATIRAANSGDAGTAYAFYPNNSIYGGDTFFGNTYDGTVNSLKNPVAGNYAWHTMIHELGHSLGLKHGHETGGPGNTSVPAQYNSIEFTVMTYASFIGDTGSGYDYETFGAPQTYMMIDILALQTMYGADFTINSGNTTYTWDPNTGDSYINGSLAIDPGANRVFSTIWDGNGTDTYDLSNYSTDARIDLRPGESSTLSDTQLAFLGGGPNGGFARGNVFNAFQFNSDSRSLIENAKGGSGNDKLTGNDIANVLNGNGGDDTFDGNGGVDEVKGNGGNDTFKMDSGDGIDNFNGGSGNDTIDFTGLGGNFVVVNLNAETWDFLGGGGILGDAINVENILGTAGNDDLFGNNRSNKLSGRLGDDFLRGGGGGDKLNGNDGDDTLRGFDGTDILSGGIGKDTLYGGLDRDRFVFSSLNASSVALSGRDVITDFSQNKHERLDLSGIDAKASVGGNQAFTFIGSSGFTSHQGELRYRQAGNSTIIQGDVNGDGVADFAIELADKINLVSGDFVL